METHAHHLHHAPGNKFWHYFYEFLMLFLAVSCGFWAENLRERNVEHNREKEYMKSLVEDLKLDTAQYSRIKLFRLDRLGKIDSILIFFQEHTNGPVPYYGYTLANKLFGHAAFFQNSGTLDQLKNSGGLRMIRHRNVVDSIQSYEQQIKRIELRDIYETNFSMDHNKLLQKLFDGKSILIHFSAINLINKPKNQTYTIKLKEQYLSEYLNSLRAFQYLVNQDMLLQATVKGKAIRLIALIKNEYHLE